MAKIPSSIEIPSKIKNIYIEISGYNFNHGTSNFGYFVGRTDVLNRLKALLTNTSFSGGSYLITGYRGMGKTTLVEKALSDINLQKKRE